MDNPQEELQKEIKDEGSARPWLPRKNWLSRHMLLGYAFLGLVIAGAVWAGYELKYGGKKSTDRNDQVCIQMIQRARNIQTGEEKDFPTPCDVPEGWEKINEIDETATWQTYRNEKYGFEFKYPKGWILDEYSASKPWDNIPEQNATCCISLYSSQKGATTIGGAPGEAAIGVQLYPSAQAAQFEEWFNRYKKRENGTFGSSETATYADVQIHDVTIGGLPAKMQRYVGVSGWVQPGPGKEVYFVHNERIWEISFSTHSPDEKNLEKTFDQILSTFKFIEPEISKGWLLIYDPSVTVSELQGKGFKPLVWYLVPKNVNFPGTLETAIELRFIKNKSMCSGEVCNSDDSKWGYGDRVRIKGMKYGDVLEVSEMEIVSSLPIEQW